ncbi:MAG TPA: hypothetical protein VIJ94_18390 [Caulobacteraceae bacterium]
MGRSLTMLLAAMLLLAGAPLRASAASSPPACDRACLSGLLDAYLVALKAHDPSRLPLADGVKFTENGVPLAVGDGLWNTLDQIGDYKLPFIDPEDGQAGLYGVVFEDGKPAQLMVRLEVEAGKISQIETIVLRPQENNGFGQPLAMKPRAAFYADVPPDQRLTKIQLSAMANAYFDTLQQNNGTVFAPFAADCDRIESGVETTNNQAPPKVGRPDPTGIKKLGCEAQFKTGFFRFVTHIRDRRFLIADRQKGLIYAAAFFDHQGDLRKETLTDGRVADTQYDTPWTWQIGELFKVKDGKIHEVEALVMHAPYGLQDVWSDHPQWRPAH